MLNSDLVTRLADVLANETLAENVRKKGERLHQRLSSPIRIVLLGPDENGKDRVFEMLAARPIQNTSISVAPNGCADAFETADICLWCTSEFGPAEATHWQRAPDRLKDHSFLVPTATPETASAWFSEERLSVLEDVASEEFHSMFPVVIGAQPAGDSDCSFEALNVEMSRLINSGLAADRDNAEFFLQPFQTTSSDAALVSDQALREDIREGAPDVECAAAAQQSDDDAAPVEIYQKSFDYICERAGELTLPDMDDDAGISHVLTTCRETTEAVGDMFSENRCNNPDFLFLKEDILCAADKLLLMSIEGGVAPAVDAVTTLLQVKRDMQARLIG